MLKLGNFCPINHWREVEGVPHFADGRSLIVEDDSGRRFVNITDSDLRKACGVHIVAIPFLVALVPIANLVRAVFSGFQEAGSLKKRCLPLVASVARVCASPLTLMALEVAAVWGLIRPRDGRKMMSSIVALGLEDKSVSQREIVKAFNLGRYDDLPLEERRAFLPPDLSDQAGIRWENLSRATQELVLDGVPCIAPYIRRQLAAGRMVTSALIEEAMTGLFPTVFGQITVD